MDEISKNLVAVIALHLDARDQRIDGADREHVDTTRWERRYNGMAGSAFKREVDEFVADVLGVIEIPKMRGSSACLYPIK